MAFLDLKKQIAKILETIKTDYVVEQGTSGIWTYRKWNSGIAECWGCYTRPTANFVAWASSIYYSYVAGVDFPTDFFIDVPVVTQFIQSEPGRIMLMGAQNASFGTSATKTSSGGCTLFAADSYYNGKSFIVAQFITAKGRWK